MSQIAPCPHCGERDYVYANVRAYGWCQQFFDTDGHADSIETDRLCFTRSATLRCTSCMRVRRDIERHKQSVRMKVRP